MKKALFILLAVACAFAIVWALQPWDGTGPPVASEPAPRTGEVVQGQTMTADPDTPVLDAGEAAEETTGPGLQREELQPTLSPEMTVTLRGRCVDVEGSTLAGVEVRVHGFTANSERMDAYLATHDRVEWEDPDTVITEDDGTFSFSFVPPPPYQFSLTASKEGAVSMTGRWGQLEPGEVKDFGDVPFVQGVSVSGRVVDTDGAPQDRVSVRLQNDQPPLREGLYPRTPNSARSRPDGTFAFSQVVPEGSWELSVGGRQLVEPSTVTLSAEDPMAFVEVVTKRAADIEKLSGIVVDEQGVPVARAHVAFSSEIYGGPSAISTREGAFTIQRREGSPDSSRITVEMLGFEYLTTEESYEWGRSDLRLVLQRGIEVEVLVLDAETGEPVEEYGLRCYLDPRVVGHWSSSDVEVQRREEHEGGLTVLSGVRKGTNVLIVEPSATGHAPSGVLTFEATESGAPRQVVHLHRNIERTLLVVDREENPVSGTAVELVRPVGDQPIDLETRPVLLSGSLGSNNALLIQEGSTGPDGRLELVGPQLEKLGLRVLGPGHQPLVIDEFTLDPDVDPLKVVVSRGATVVGRVGPLEAVRTFDIDPQVLATRRDSERYKPGIRLANPDNSRETFPLQNGSVILEEDGTFVAPGVPPGSWDLSFAYSAVSERSASRSFFHVQSLLDLRDGETREVDIDIGHLRKGRLSARIFLNDRPLAGASVAASGKILDGKGQEASVGSQNIRTDEAGSVSMDLVPATYTLRVQFQPEGSNEWVFAPSPESFSLAAGQEVDRVFRLQSRRLRVRVLGSDGETPIEGLMLTTRSGEWGASVQTDAEGWASFPSAPIGAVRLSSFHKDFNSQEARFEYYQTNREVPAPMDLISVQVMAAEAETEARLIMPVESGY